MGTVGTTILNPNGVSLWRNSTDDVWHREGVWAVVNGKPQILRPDHFSVVRGRSVHFAKDYLKPLVLQVLEGIRKVDESALIFFEGPPMPIGEPPPWNDSDPKGVVHAGHFYDGMAPVSYTHLDVYKRQVPIKLPDGFTCNNCTLQVIQWMYNHPLNNPGGCFYHHCATVNIVAGTDAGMTIPADMSDAPAVPEGCSCHVGNGRSTGAGAAAALSVLLGIGLLSRRRRAAGGNS